MHKMEIHTLYYIHCIYTAYLYTLFTVHTVLGEQVKVYHLLAMHQKSCTEKDAMTMP